MQWWEDMEMPIVNRSQKSALGFSLIEVLVSLIVISLGILGASGLLLKAMSNSKTSESRTVAAMQASSLANSMYANRLFWADTSKSISFQTDGETIVSQTNITADSTTNCNTSSAVCNAKQMAEYDVGQWKLSLNRALPGATSKVACQPSASNLPQNCLIDISWVEGFVNSSTASVNESTAIAETSATDGTRHFFLHVNP